ncbi:hypothetical protein DICPUDRAFT_58977 [Dictyostelium purpureum]|uniref:E2 ubiquitin-conjugating enzyme n=1 Tax=Dictyostelium purpureum TaxID=5786 RepID=F1A3S7_DICPU|nr:uncharacterized protein DICPUDRAFT_58977 [Dictyostelium purpureum]EGC29154.1 hypothetical protein DICPUDRAFT_58977 [Dictyostelium purpureum]|eukprot:XP_003294321.1 hypothetical protein DICPUDRAFT_58977 [Dictyostelium purpureum]
MSTKASLLLQKQLAHLKKHPIEGFSAGLIDESNIYEWQIMIMGPSETPYEGGIFYATLTFTPEYPDKPPKMKFTSEMWHPNVYKEGEVCISILHEGEDAYGYEKANERWTPVHTVESILISVISMLSSPNDESPANIDAAKEWRSQREVFNKKVQRIVRKSQDA